MNAIMHGSQSNIFDQESFIGFAQYYSISRLRVPTFLGSMNNALNTHVQVIVWMWFYTFFG